ncbi:MAG: DUF6364 family protein [Mucilaginibacter sp.]
METSKLTLSIKADKIAKAKKYAEEHHTSVSKLVDQFFDEITKETNIQDDPLLKRLSEITIPDDIKQLTGILKGKVPDDVNLQDLKYEYLKEKYGL